MTTYLTLTDVFDIHEGLTGNRETRDIGSIQAAIGRPQVIAFGREAYPGLHEKAAALMHSLTRNHGFVDGNKRTAWIATVTFLGINGHPLKTGFDQVEAERLTLAVATGELEDIGVIARQLGKFTG